MFRFRQYFRTKICTRAASGYVEDILLGTILLLRLDFPFESMNWQDSVMEVPLLKYESSFEKITIDRCCLDE